MKDAFSIDRELAMLGRMTVGELRERYGEVWQEPARSFNRQHLIKRVAWRLQALHEGDLSQRARRRAAELARDADLRITAPRTSPTVAAAGETTVTTAFRSNADPSLPMPGTLLRRAYKGRMVQVRVLPQGFEFEGDVFRSLSAVAHKVTGSHWNGRLFFGLGKAQREAREGKS